MTVRCQLVIDIRASGERAQPLAIGKQRVGADTPSR